MPSRIFDALILSAGPVGLYTAVSLARVRPTTLLIFHRTFRNRGTLPADVRWTGQEQIEKYDVGIAFAEGDATKVHKVDFWGGYGGFEIV